VKDRTEKTRRRDDHLDKARPEPGSGFAATGIDPALREIVLTSHPA
jgi:hypothetical protein